MTSQGVREKIPHVQLGIFSELQSLMLASIARETQRMELNPLGALGSGVR